MSDILNDFSTKALTTAIKGNLFEYHEYLGRSPKAEFHQGPPLTWVFTGIPHSFMNNVLDTQLTAENVDEAIQQMLADCKSRNIPRISWWVEPGTKPADLGKHLATHG